MKNSKVSFIFSKRLTHLSDHEDAVNKSTTVKKLCDIVCYKPYIYNSLTKMFHKAIIYGIIHGLAWNYYTYCVLVSSESSGDSGSAGAAVGGVIGGILVLIFLVVLVLVIVFYIRRSQRRDKLSINHENHESIDSKGNS